MSCNFTSRNDLLPFEQDPNTDLESLIAGCKTVCNLVYGSGNPDLAGIGVIISYALQLASAILYGPVIFADVFFFSALRKPRRTSRFVAWLSQSHHTCLWSQLLFSFGIALACLVRQTQESCSIYENSMIGRIAGLNTMSFLITLSSYYYPVERMVVFAGSIIATYVFTLLAEFILAVHPPKYQRIIRACVRSVEDEKYLSIRYLVGMLNSEPIVSSELVADTCIVFILTGMWLFLWLQRGRKVQALEDFSFSARDKPERGKTIEPFQRSEHTKTEWVVGSGVMLTSLTLTGVAAYLLDGIMQARRGMIMNYGVRTAENEWGIGQIGAMFIWAPLLVEMGYTAAEEWKNARYRRLRQS